MDTYTYARDLALAVYKNRRAEAHGRYQRSLRASTKRYKRDRLLANAWASKRPQMRAEADAARDDRHRRMCQERDRTLEWAARDYMQVVDRWASRNQDLA